MVRPGPRVGIDHKIRWADLDMVYHWWLRGESISPATLIPRWQHIQGQAARKKAATIMTRLWNQSFWQDPLNYDVLVKTLNENRILGYWGLFITAYPFFRDTVTAIGRLLALSEGFTTRQVYAQIATIYGDTERVRVGVRMILGSLTEWQVLKREKIGHYRLHSSPVTVVGAELLTFVLYATLQTLDQDRIALDTVGHLPWWFPFQIEASRWTLRSTGLVIEPSGGEHLMVGRPFSSV
ncbi:hypothetical protein [Sulfobacillus thermosulfidooxidans]|uniref:hypothetical protein n=1 Tax=Sulfobacillus thermosulfidooxidans TaxID=28034 RepID=UPI00096BA179|nr:hypothetical protein [Sulfobacillus thermosulfidooxidans]OLZ11237.1 hypothetical protein BFX05_08135 [Sulfobacillus thermosulfidooxidans]OLZ13424.1 hypothetical protein BFX06_09630 [Sulfobacillus thermosulfidooxidans]OLZ21671.1 hypothetical protein BFX07_12680 [Sulfobacillus thermosulfidooxidans]